jgi:hypothetical protein
MSLTVGSLIGFFIPVFTSGLYEEGLSNDDKKQRVQKYLLNEALFALTVFILTQAFWIPGHTKDSILKLIKNKD